MHHFSPHMGAYVYIYITTSAHACAETYGQLNIPIVPNERLSYYAMTNRVIVSESEWVVTYRPESPCIEALGGANAVGLFAVVVWQNWLHFLKIL